MQCCSNPTPNVSEVIPVTWKPLRSADHFDCLDIGADLKMEVITNVNKQMVKKSKSNLWACIFVKILSAHGHWVLRIVVALREFWPIVREQVIVEIKTCYASVVHEYSVISTRRTVSVGQNDEKPFPSKFVIKKNNLEQSIIFQKIA